MGRYLPVLVLLFLSPLVGEILLGATTVSRLETAVPLIFFYGGGAIIIRELARRRGPGWGRIVTLAVVYGIIEEGLVTQTLFNPDLFRAALIGGRALGVNGVWSEWVVGYHAVYSIAIPILLVELLFPARGDQPWLGPKALAAVSVLYVLSAALIGVAFRTVIAPGFRAPMPLMVGTTLLVVGLGMAAILWPARPGPRPGPVPAAVPPPWLVGLAALLAASAWMLLLGLPQWLKTGILALVPMASGLILAGGSMAMIRRWADRRGPWGDRHRLALVMGALPPVMLFGFLVVTRGKGIDQIGQGVASVAAMGWLILLTFRARRRDGAGHGNPSVIPSEPTLAAQAAPSSPQELS
jgi:hypothetical protein